MAQRERILDAAQRCFVAQGFHAASMASVAQAADMSAGLIYRYFPGKHAIILAIIERELARGQARIAALPSAVDVAGELVQALRRWRHGDPDDFNVPLFLSMTADATRDPTIAAALRDSDRRIREDLVAWLAAGADRGGFGLPEATARARVGLLQIVFEGLAVRSAREPDLDPASLEPELRRLFAVLLAP
jgi:AcrR family transcriptional regulator